MSTVDRVKIGQCHVDDLKKLGFRSVETNLMMVVEDTIDYKLALANCHLPSGEAQVFRLWLVLLPDFVGPSAKRYAARTVYVLAPTGQDAISQATCGPGDEIPYEDQAGWEKVAAFAQVPFRVRGWSNHSF